MTLSKGSIRMSGDRLLVDTNAAVPLLNGDVAAGAFFAEASSLVLCPPVYGELVFGALKSSRAADNLFKLAGFLRACDFVVIDEVTSEQFGHLRAELQRKGRPIPENDLWIASLALQHQMPVVTFDAHFGFVDGVEVRSWRA